MAVIEKQLPMAQTKVEDGWLGKLVGAYTAFARQGLAGALNLMRANRCPRQ